MNKGQWKIVEDETGKVEWNELLTALPNASPFQSFEWGEFHRGLGWQPMRLGLFDDNGAVQAVALVLIRRFPMRTGFAWCAGGPAGGTALTSSVSEAVMRLGGFKRLFFRMRCDSEFDVTDSLELAADKWTRSIYLMASGYSMILDLSSTEEEILAGFSAKWRRNLRKSQQNGLSITRVFDPDIAEMEAAFAEMEKAKGLQQLFPKAKLEQLFKQNRTNLVFLICRDHDQKLLSLRGALVSGTTGVDYLAATTDEGRKKGASFLTTYEIFRLCKEKGVTKYDMGGIDPVRNPGVYKFKKGVGARPVELLGEWDWASSNWIRYTGNLLLAKRQSGGFKRNSGAHRTRGLSNMYSLAARMFNL